MTNIVWDAENGWVDGPETTIHVDTQGRIKVTGREVARQAISLNRQWRDALATCRDLETEEASQAEQEAYDALVDYVEANGLNYTRHDPRGSNR